MERSLKFLSGQRIVKKIYDHIDWICQNCKGFFSTVKSWFYVTRFYVKSRYFFEKSNDQIQNLLNEIIQFYNIFGLKDIFTDYQQFVLTSSLHCIYFYK